MEDAAQLRSKAAKARVASEQLRIQAEARERIADLLESTPGVETVGDLMARAERESDEETLALLRRVSS